MITNGHLFKNNPLYLQLETLQEKRADALAAFSNPEYAQLSGRYYTYKSFFPLLSTLFHDSTSPYAPLLKRIQTFYIYHNEMLPRKPKLSVNYPKHIITETALIIGWITAIWYGTKYFLKDK